MKGKLKKLLLFTTIMVLLVGVATASEVFTDADTPSSDTHAVVEKAVQEKPTVSPGDTDTVENIKQESDTNLIKNIEKTTGNNLKKDTTVDSWTTLNSTITEATQDTTITLTKKTYTVTGRIDFNKAITITIDGNGSTIDGNQKQIFWIDSKSSVILKNITIINAENNNGYGGAIDNGGNLTIINSTLKNNTARYGGAINNNNGNITIIDSNITQNKATGEFSGLGGAIVNNGTGSNLTILNSNLTQNKATGQNIGVGGAIYNSGTLNITQSNLNNNTAIGQQNSGYGGAIYNEGGTLTITQSNLTQNTGTGQQEGVGGAIYNAYGGNLTITQSNLTQNTATGQERNGVGGAIYNIDGGTLTITQSNFTQNKATGQDGYGGAIWNQGRINSTNSIFDLNTPVNYKINDEKHIQLENTDYYIPGEATYAIYLDNNEECVYTGPLNGYTVPKNHIIRLVVNGNDRNVFGNNTFILCSYDKVVTCYQELVEAVMYSLEIQQEEYSIYLYPGDYNATFSMLFAGYSRKLFINGNGLTLDGKNTYHFMDVGTGSTLELYNITITNYTRGIMGAIHNYGTLTITQSNLTQNNVDRGTIYNYGGTVNITGSNINYNNAFRGSAIFNNGGSVNIMDSTLAYNTAYEGGAIYNEGGTVNITGSNINYNKAEFLGGAISNEEGTITITGSNFINNTAIGGGAIKNYIGDGSIVITDSNFSYNTAHDGSAIENTDGGTVNITDSNFTYNTAEMDGTIINTGTLTIIRSNFTYNNAYEGSSIANYNGGTVNITDSHFAYNNATVGGAIHNYNGILTINNTNFTDNTATGEKNVCGGAIYNHDGTLNITSSNLTNNTANNGGAIFNNGTCSNLTILDSLLENNNASIGGALYNDIGILTIRNTNLTYNNADNGGAIFIDKFDSSSSGNPDDSQQSYNDRILLTGCMLDYNNATYEGGALFGNENTFITISGCDFNYNLADYGGAIESYGTVNITESTFKYNVANGAGAIDCCGGYITDSNLTCNNATLFGGAIINGNEILIIDECTISNNSVNNMSEDDAGDDLLLVSYSGGAIYNNGILNIKSTKIENNYAPHNGGAIYNNNAYLDMFNVTLNRNMAEDNGGALINNVSDIDDTILGYLPIDDTEVACYPGTVVITKSIISNNSAFEVGAILNEYGIMNISDSSIEKNNASISIIENYNGNLTIKNTSIINNTATIIGNIILNFANQEKTNDQIYGLAKNIKTAPIADEIEKIESNLIIINSTLNNNKAFSGVIANMVQLSDEYPECYANVLVKESTFEYNQASFGGVIYNNGKNANTNVTNSTIEFNNADYGGAVMNEEGMININTTVFANNTANIGSAIYNMANATIYNNTFKTNKASTGEKAIEVTGGNPIIKDNINDKTSRYYSTIETNGEGVTIINNIFDDNTINTSLTITTNNTNPTVEDKIKIIFTLKGNDNNLLANQNITINIDGIKYNKTTDNKGIATVDYILKTNITQVTADYNGYYSYNQSNSSKNIVANKINTKLTLNASNTTPINNTRITITATLTDAKNNKLAGYDIILNLNGKTVTIKTDNNGMITQSYTPTTLGKQTITATYNGDNKYNNTTATTNITVKKINSKLALKVSNSTPVLNTSINITATLTDIDGNKLSGQNVTIIAGGKTSTLKTNTNGQAILIYTPTKAETQNITATYKGDSQHNNSTATTSITVKKINTKVAVKISNSTPVNNTNITITATLTDTDNKAVANQNITIKVSDKTFNLKTNSNGIAIQTYTPTTLGKQTITVTYKGDSQYVNSTATTNITVKKINTKLDLKVSNTTPINNTPITITVTLTDVDGNKLSNQQVTLNINGKTVTAKTNNNGIVTQNYTPTKVETQNITATYTGDSRYNNSTKTIKITVKNKIKTKATVTPVTGVIGEKLTIKATVTDTNGNNVNEGNLIFKVNGVTIKDNGKLTGSSNPLKIKIVNGVATATIIPDINMTNAKNITAYYVGTTRYNASTSSPASINISKRNATIEVTTNKNIIKQGQVLMITAKIYDTTNGKKTSNITRYQDEYVYFKINGITLKDSNGEMLKVKIVNGTATVNYTIPLGISCVTDMQTLTPKNHTIQVGLYNKNYQNIMTKTPTFQVERSNITINLANATINNKTHTLSMKITIKDYLGNTVAGPNKCIIKVNGVTLKNGTNVQYYYTTDGVLDLKNVPVPTAKNYTSVEVITQDRLAYNSQRSTTTKIKVLN